MVFPISICQWMCFTTASTSRPLSLLPDLKIKRLHRFGAYFHNQLTLRVELRRNAFLGKLQSLLAAPRGTCARRPLGSLRREQRRRRIDSYNILSGAQSLLTRNFVGAVDDSCPR